VLHAFIRWSAGKSRRRIAFQQRLIGPGLAAASVAQSLLEVYDAGDYCEHAEDRASRHA